MSVRTEICSHCVYVVYLGLAGLEILIPTLAYYEMRLLYPNL